MPAGDYAAVPDLTRPGQVCGMTAQHAQRQGKRVARNMAAPLDIGKAQPYAVTRGYHLSLSQGTSCGYSPTGRRTRSPPRKPTSFGVIRAESVPLDVDNPWA